MKIPCPVNCGSTGGCRKCRDDFIIDSEAEKMKGKIEKFKRDFDEDLEKRRKELFNNL